MILDFMLVMTTVLLFSTASALYLYYRRILALRHECDEAKGIVKDIVVNVGNEFRRQKDRFLFVAQKIEKVSLENKKVEEKVKKYDEQLADLSRFISDVPAIEEKVSSQLKEMYNNFEGIKDTQDRIVKKLIEIEKIKQKAPVPEVKIEAAIPIKKEKALEPLTETELSVLEIIGREGEKTAPEIKEKIGLTREHTARLMKKLYKDGYLERDTHKMPYMYRLKEEMDKIMKKRDVSAS